jgi:diguanylate cyclase (GGDEF)-like protein
MTDSADSERCLQLQGEVHQLKEEIRILEERNRNLEMLASVDELTGVCNRRTFDARLAVEVERGRRGIEKTISLIVFDLDHFKVINDTYGHPAGDEVLRCVGKILKKRVRLSDTAARVGGEEFGLILPATGVSEAIALAEDLRSRIEHHAVRLDEEYTIKITASFGVVKWNEEMNPLLFFKEADLLLYNAKRLGRNCVCGPVS